MTFREIPDIDGVQKQLTAQVDHDRIAHAQIFLGRSGTSKLATALAFASYILCDNRTMGDSCGECKSCIKSHNFKHPDLHFAFPVVKKGSKKREDTTSQDFLQEWRQALSNNPYMDIQAWSQIIGAEKSQPNINTRECNDMIKQLGMRSFESAYKIQLIWLPEYLGKEGNRLLKMIEEPTDKTIIILVAENQEKILNTVLSRCQIVKINPVNDESAIKYLLEKKPGTQSDIISQAVLMSDGNLFNAMQILDGSNIDFSQSLLTWMRIAYKRDYLELNKWITQMAINGREDLKHFIEYCMSYMREYAFYLQTNETSRLNDMQKSTMVNMKKIIDMQKVESVTLLLQNCHRDIMRNANPRISLMAYSIELGDILKSKNQTKQLFAL